MKKEPKTEIYINRYLIIKPQDVVIKTQAELLKQVQNFNKKSIHKTRFRNTLKDMVNQKKIVFKPETGYILNLLNQVPEALNPYADEWNRSSKFREAILKCYDIQMDRTISPQERESLKISEIFKAVAESGIVNDLKGPLATEELKEKGKNMSEGKKEKIRAGAKALGLDVQK